MPRGLAESGGRETNPAGTDSPAKCGTCGQLVEWKRRIEHSLKHQEAVNCDVQGCERKYKNKPLKKRDHYELYHEAECIRLGWNYKPKIVCDLPIALCHLCSDLIRCRKERYCTNISGHLARHKQRAKAYRNADERVTCKVMCKIRRPDGSVTNVPCRKSYSDGEGLGRICVG